MAAFAACRSGGPQLPSLKETFSKNDDDPFGTRVMFKQSKQLFKKNEMEVKKVSLLKSIEESYDSTGLYINVSKNFFLSEEELTAALNYVYKGNSMFIASESFDSGFLKAMDVNTAALNVYRSIDNMKQTSVQLNPKFFYDSAAYDYYYLPLDHHFIRRENDSVPNVLGRDEYGRPNFIVLFYGAGRFFIHCEPRVFSNYFLLQHNNYKYLQQALSFLPAVPAHVIWDDYYNKRNSPLSGENAKSGLGVLLQYPAMAWAFYLVLGLLILYILFGGKRRQRIVETMQPNVNTSLAFAETVSRLYLQKKDNRGIADKMILYFLEHLRSQYFLNTHLVNELFLSTLSRKANVPLDQTERLFETISTVQKSANINDQQLIQLHSQIANFYKNKT